MSNPLMRSAWTATTLFVVPIPTNISAFAICVITLASLTPDPSTNNSLSKIPFNESDDIVTASFTNCDCQLLRTVNHSNVMSPVAIGFSIVYVLPSLTISYSLVIAPCDALALGVAGVATAVADSYLSMKNSKVGVGSTTLILNSWLISEPAGPPVTLTVYSPAGVPRSMYWKKLINWLVSAAPPDVDKLPAKFWNDLICNALRSSLDVFSTSIPLNSVPVIPNNELGPETATLHWLVPNSCLAKFLNKKLTVNLFVKFESAAPPLLLSTGTFVEKGFVTTYSPAVFSKTGKSLYSAS